MARVEARLQLTDPIPARSEYEVRIGLQLLLKPALIELRIAERGEARGQAAESPDEPDLSGDWRSPASWAVVKERRSNSRPVRRCLDQGLIK